jgi:hypothetical protein
VDLELGLELRRVANAAYAAWSPWAVGATSGPVITLQTCDGVTSAYRILVRLVPTPRVARPDLKPVTKQAGSQDGIGMASMRTLRDWAGTLGDGHPDSTSSALADVQKRAGQGGSCRARR